MGGYLPDFKNRSPSLLSVDTEDMHRGALTVPSSFPFHFGAYHLPAKGVTVNLCVFTKTLKKNCDFFKKSKNKNKTTNDNNKTHL